jgi:hypothetical protein
MKGNEKDKREKKRRVKRICVFVNGNKTRKMCKENEG